MERNPTPYDGASGPSVSTINGQIFCDDWTVEITHSTEQSEPLISEKDGPDVHNYNLPIHNCVALTPFHSTHFQPSTYQCQNGKQKNPNQSMSNISYTPGKNNAFTHGRAEKKKRKEFMVGV